jgi:hypothetical protein
LQIAPGTPKPVSNDKKQQPHSPGVIVRLQDEVSKLREQLKKLSQPVELKPPEPKESKMEDEAQPHPQQEAPLKPKLLVIDTCAILELSDIVKAFQILEDHYRKTRNVVWKIMVGLVRSK